MKRLLILSFALALVGCGEEYNDIDYKRMASGGISSPVDKTIDSSRPNNSDSSTDSKNWIYKSLETDKRVFLLRANNYALNTYQRPDYNKLEARPWIELEKQLDSNDKTDESVTIYVLSKTSCTPSCNVRMNFDGTWATYRMKNHASIDDIIKPINQETEITLFKKFTTSNKATISLPIIGLSEPFDAEFDLSGYDLSKMKFYNK